MLLHRHHSANWFAISRMVAIICFLVALFPALPAFADNAEDAFNAADDRKWPQAMRAAERSSENNLPLYIHWRMLRDSLNRQDVSDYLRFLRQHPDWPEREVIGRRAAEAMLLQGYTPNAEQEWQKLLDKKETVFVYAWQEGRFHGSEQQSLLKKFGDKLSTKAIEARIDALLWEKQIQPALALLPRSSRDFRRIAEARIAFLTRAKDAGSKRRLLSPREQKDPALLFARIDYHYRKKQHSSAEALLKDTPEAVPHADKWWQYWRYYAREALDNGRVKDAYAVLKPIKQAEKGGMAQLFWLRGWIQLQFLNQPRGAYEDFYTFFKHVGTPISLARGAYWAGLAAQANGNGNIARNWFREAGKWPMSFYGQMALLEQESYPQLPFSQESLSASQSRALRQQASLITLLAYYDQRYSVESFLLNLAAQSRDKNELMAIARFAQSLNLPHLGIRLAKDHFSANQQWVQAIAHPLIKLPSKVAVDPALALAIIRQESEFNPQARSSANARGLMQLLPSTARHVARQAEIDTDTEQLYEPAHNIQLGSLYLRSLLERFDGVLPLAIASYNAGPGRVDEWLQRYGAFPQDKSIAEQLKWLERIPFSETRNYVQRVMENYRVYQKLLDNGVRIRKSKAFSTS